MNPSEIQRALRNCGALASATDAELESLADAAQIRTVAAEKTLFAEGEVNTKVYVVVKGSLHVRLSETSKLVSLAESGSLFGEYAMFAKGGRIARVLAVEDCVLLSFTEVCFREFLLACPGVMMELLQTTVRRLARVERHVRASAS